MRRVAVTGGIACGKSAVADLLSAEGIPVCEADELAHRCLEPDHPVGREVVRLFGPEILTPDGRIDRAKLGDRVFADPAERAALNAVVHPEVRRRWGAWLSEREAGTPLAVVVIPLLYEVAGSAEWDRVVCVAAPEEDQVSRLEARGLRGEGIRRRLEAQMPVAEKMERADHVIYNHGTRELLREQTRRVLRELVEN